MTNYRDIYDSFAKTDMEERLNPVLRLERLYKRACVDYRYAKERKEKAKQALEGYKG